MTDTLEFAAIFPRNDQNEDTSTEGKQFEKYNQKKYASTCGNERLLIIAIGLVFVFSLIGLIVTATVISGLTKRCTHLEDTLERIQITNLTDGRDIKRKNSVLKIKGDQGPPGLIGIKGQKGELGNPGAKGSKGEQGEVGIHGGKGDAGPPGATGMKGERGEPGLKGNKGNDGQKGEQGQRGLLGFTGFKGETGQRGEKGNKGDDGQNGTHGITGPIGATGAKGQKGEVGLRGIKGSKGEAGLAGPQGPQGVIGSIGKKGEKGTQGLKGSQGQKGETASSPQCDNGWELFGGSCYFFEFRNRRTWHDALRNCKSKNAHLISINDSIEQWFIKSYVKDKNPGEIYIGFHDTAKEGKFVWEDGSTSRFTFWNNGEPNNSGGREDCAILTANRWNDIPCSARRSYICEKN